MKRAVLIVLDGLGIGATPDQDAYGDAGSDTLGNVLRAANGRLSLPNLERLGLGWCRPIPGLSRPDERTAAAGVALPRSAGKDSTTGHWELCGVVLQRPFPTYPLGFPDSLIEEFTRRTGRGVLGNRAASGTAIISEFGPLHEATGQWIVYTSADSVFQVAAHESIIPLEELYEGCRVAREILTGDAGVGRVIARPFTGRPGDYQRTGNRRDFSLLPTGVTLLDRLAEAQIPRFGIGKVDDLFAGRGISSEHAATNSAAYRLIEQALDNVASGLVFVNVLEFDQSWGHRNDVVGFQNGLRELDAWMPRLLARLREDDLVMLTADHGNDPTTPSTDHSREAVPVLVLGPRVAPRAIGERDCFADLGATIAEYFGVPPLASGTSFLRDVWN